MHAENAYQEENPQAVRILSVKFNHPLTVRFLAGYVGMLTHYRARTIPCLDEERCPPALHKTRTTWKGYAPVDEWDRTTEMWVPGVLEITESLEHFLVGRKLRGEVWGLTRKGPQKKDPVLGLFSETMDPGFLPESFDVVAVLKRFYHEEHLVLGIPNPIPRPVLLRPRQGPAPKLLGEMTSTRPEDLPVDPRVKEAFREQLKAFRKAGAEGGQARNGNQLGDQVGANGREGGGK